MPANQCLSIGTVPFAAKGRSYRCCMSARPRRSGPCPRINARTSARSRSRPRAAPTMLHVGRDPVGAGHAREPMPASKSHAPVRAVHGVARLYKSKEATLHHCGVDSIMPSFAVDGFPEFLCLRP